MLMSASSTVFVIKLAFHFGLLILLSIIKLVVRQSIENSVKRFILEII